MRFVATTLFWLLATVTLAATIPVMWLQYNVIDADGYTRMAQRAAGDPTLQSAVAAELSSQAMRLVREHNYDPQHEVDPAQVRAAAAAYTAGPAFPGQFAQLNRDGHDWLFTGGHSGPWVVDVAPMLRDSAFATLLADHDIRPPASMPVSLTSTAAGAPRPGSLQPFALWGPWASLGLAVLTAAWSVLTLLTARHRGRALAGLGVSGLLVGAAGWAGIEVGRRQLGGVLNQAAGDIRRIADVTVDLAEASLHAWLNATLIAGAVLVVGGVAVAMLGGLTGRLRAVRASRRPASANR